MCKSDEQLSHIEFLNVLSPSGLPRRIIKVRIDCIAILFILRQLKTSQLDKFPTKISFTKTVNKAQGQTLRHVGTH